MQKIIVASGPVIVEEGKVLLNQHGDTDFWKFCGGKADDLSETLFETAQREFREEMGAEIKALKKEPFVMHTEKETSEGKIDVLLVHYLAERIGEINPGSDIREWRWFPLEDLPKNLGPNIIPALRSFGFLK